MGLFDTALDLAVGRRDRDHAEHREDRLRYQDRQYFEADRKEQRKYDATALQRLRADAEAAGYHPLAALGGGQTVGPATSFMSQSYGSGGTPNFRSTISDGGASEVNKAQANLLNKQVELIDQQILDSKVARAGVTPGKLIEEIVNPQRTTHVSKGGILKSNPNFTDAESDEQRYGELMGALLGMVNLPADMFYTWFRNKKAGKHGGANVGYDLPPELRKKLFGR